MPNKKIIKDLDIQVKSEHEGIRLDQYLANQFPNLSRSYIQKQIKSQKVLINSNPCRKGDLLKSNDQILILELLEKSERKPPGNANLSINILFEDAFLAVIEKPAGIPTHPVNHEETRTVTNWWIAHVPHLLDWASDPLRAGIVHRLDTGTSGLLILAKTADTLELIQKQFKARHIHKEYMALVFGHPPGEGSVHFPLAHDPKSKRRMKAVTDERDKMSLKAKAAQTDYVVEKYYEEGVALLRVRTRTGRMHQVRVHLQAIGHSLVGDQIYRKYAQPQKLPKSLPRHFLHASYIKFNHPVSQETLEIKSPLATCAVASDLQDLLNALTLLNV